MFSMPTVPSQLPPKGGYKISNLNAKPDLSNMLSKNLESPGRAKNNSAIPTPKGQGSSSKSRAISKDSDLLTSMTKRLTQLEGLNQALRLEVKEKGLQINTLMLENETLRLASDKNSIKEVSEIIQERDRYRK